MPDISKWNIFNNDKRKIELTEEINESFIDLFFEPTNNSENDIVFHNDLFLDNFSFKRDKSKKLKIHDINKGLNYYYLNCLFAGCSSLKYLPNISKWNIDNVIRIDRLFFGCRSLIELPDISKWNTKNIENMDSLFKNCSS